MSLGLRKLGREEGSAQAELVNQRTRIKKLRTMFFYATPLEKAKTFWHFFERLARRGASPLRIIQEERSGALGKDFSLEPASLMLAGMNSNPVATRSYRVKPVIAVALLLLCTGILRLFPMSAQAAESDSAFSKGVIDVGIVVKDAQRMAEFLTNAIGFKEVKGFSVTPELGRKIGLVDGHAVDVRVFRLTEGDAATSIKVLSFPKAENKTPDQKYIHSTLGIRYFTLYVKDMTASVARLKAAGVKPIGETPLDLGGGTYITVVRDPDGNFFELIGPMAKRAN
jgi:catechol 2,3-dioxygenase-like lactoylglutathione lyase family enzyme